MSDFEEARSEYERNEYLWSRRGNSENKKPDDYRNVCEVCTETKPDLVMREHHVSYKRNEIILVCESCHAKIHSTDQHPDLLPDMSREEAKDQGYLD